MSNGKGWQRRPTNWKHWRKNYEDIFRKEVKKPRRSRRIKSTLDDS